jgi:hypothetical protein
MTVSSRQLAAAGAMWVDGPEVGGWIAERLAPFGPSVGHAAPIGYAAYAVVPIVADDDGEPFETLRALEPVLGALEASTQDQRVHTAMWDGWGWWYETGTTPRPAGVGVYWDQDGPQPSPNEIERARADARDKVADAMVEYPDAAPLELPERRYYVWTGPLRSATAFHDRLHDPPSLIWPDDRAWFIGIPIYTFEIAIAGSLPVIDAIVADPMLNARRVHTDYELEGDD